MAQAESATYPVTIRGDLTEPINRWLFLFKWLFVIPHLIVLVFLYVGFVVSWVVSFFAILFTGKYPKGLFDYNVGVLRWSWRVGFYSYQALGTDKYPPFSLQKQDDYPADLDAQYPENLSRGLVLIKWWLLAIPHYLIVGAFDGGLGYRYGGLQLALVLFAAIGNLFNGAYPKDIFAFAMGINRWAYRVAGYAALFTDKYPPFSIAR